jgi:hypothetical protein
LRRIELKEDEREGNCVECDKDAQEVHPPALREKQRVLRGVLAAIRADAVTANEERELFRLIAIVFDCPLPPDIVL